MKHNRSTDRVGQLDMKHKLTLTNFPRNGLLYKKLVTLDYWYTFSFCWRWKNIHKCL